jgi:hypothetical protein
MYIAVATLLHLAEEPSVQRKMRKKVGGCEGALRVLLYCSPDNPGVLQQHGSKLIIYNAINV